MALSSTQEIILKALAASPLKRRFYWTGGTLLAEKYLQHRHSHDVDLFSDHPFRYEDVSPLVKTIKQHGHFKVVEEKKIFDRWEFFIHNHRAVRCEFVHYDFKPLKPRGAWRGVLTDSLDDLVANKTMAALDRREPKDVVDIYFLMVKKKLPLQKLLRLANKKFSIQISPATLLGNLAMNSRLLPTITPLLLGTASEQSKLVETIQKYFKCLSADFVRHQLKQ